MLLCNITALRNLSIKAQSKACTHYRLSYGKHACMAQIGLIEWRLRRNIVPELMSLVLDLMTVTAGKFR